LWGVAGKRDKLALIESIGSKWVNRTMSTTDPSQEAARALAAVSYFMGLDAVIVEAVAQVMIRRSYDANQVVFLEGDPGQAVYIVQEGWLKAVKTSPDGREQILHFMGPGEVFNAIGVFIAVSNPATVIALEPTTVWIIPRNDILRLLDEHPPLAQQVIQRLAERVQQLIAVVEDLSLRTIEARLARYLLEQSAEETLHRQRWATQAEIASRLGTVPDVINRALRNLVRENLIQVERHQIQILDRVGLEMKAGLDK
jgi:CRP-like cAMP-binding protein